MTEDLTKINNPLSRNPYIRHRVTEGLSAIGKRIIESCPNAYVNDLGEVIDPCHFYTSTANNHTKWGE